VSGEKHCQRYAKNLKRHSIKWNGGWQPSQDFLPGRTQLLSDLRVYGGAFTARERQDQPKGEPTLTMG
jgi:hypothetical protein